MTRNPIVPLILRSLTPPQRACILWLTPEWQDEPKGARMFYLVGKRVASDVWVRLAEYVLSDPSAFRHAPRKWRLTKLGRLVRVALVAEGARV